MLIASHPATPNMIVPSLQQPRPVQRCLPRPRDGLVTGVSGLGDEYRRQRQLRVGHAGLAAGGVGELGQEPSASVDFQQQIRQIHLGRIRSVNSRSATSDGDSASFSSASTRT